MGAETTFIDRFTPPAIASMAYLPCCDEWADCRETEECPFCGVDLAKEECWGPDLRLVKAVFKFDHLETEGKFGQPPLPWTMDEALTSLTRKAESEEPHIEVPDPVIPRTDCPHVGCILAEGHTGYHDFGHGDGYDGCRPLLTMIEPDQEVKKEPFMDCPMCGRIFRDPGAK